MILKIGDVEYRTLKAYKTQKLQKAMDSIWVEVDPCYIIYDIVEAAFLEGKKSERERIRLLLGLDWR